MPEKDLEYLSFNKLELTVPIPVLETGPEIQSLVREMISFKASIEREMEDEERKELRGFWLRKSGKP